MVHTPIYTGPTRTTLLINNQLTLYHHYQYVSSRFRFIPFSSLSRNIDNCVHSCRAIMTSSGWGTDRCSLETRCNKVITTSQYSVGRLNNSQSIRHDYSYRPLFEMFNSIAADALLFLYFEEDLNRETVTVMQRECTPPPLYLVNRIGIGRQLQRNLWRQFKSHPSLMMTTTQQQEKS